MPKAPKRPFLQVRANRVYLYNIVAAVATLLAGVGIITDGDAQNILAVVSAVLAILFSRLAVKNASGD